MAAASKTVQEQPTDSLGNIEIRPPEPGDVSEILNLVSACGPWLTPHHSYVFWLTVRCCNRICAVAVLDGHLVGWCSIFPESGVAFLLHQLAVAPVLRQKGLAVSLVGYLVNKLRTQEGAFRLEFTVDRRNVAAQKLFRSVAERVGMRVVSKSEPVQLVENDCEEQLYELLDYDIPNHNDDRGA